MIIISSVLVSQGQRVQTNGVDTFQHMMWHACAGQILCYPEFCVQSFSMKSSTGSDLVQDVEQDLCIVPEAQHPKACLAATSSTVHLMRAFS